MDRTLQGHLLTEGHIKRALLARGIAWGFLGGLAGTMVMDILLMGALLALGQPALMCFSIVGDTVSRFLAMFGTDRRWHSNRRGCALFDRSAGRHHFWSSCDDVPCSCEKAL